MTPETVVCDTGPILHLLEAGCLDLLAVIPCVFVPPSVESELSRLIDNWPRRRPDWLQIRELEPDSTEQANGWIASGLLHQGEADALALAIRWKVPWYLTDDTSARELAKVVGVQARGSLGVVLWAAASGYLATEEAFVRLEGLFQSSLWISAAIRTEAQEALKAILVSKGPPPG